MKTGRVQNWGRVGALGGLLVGLGGGLGTSGAMARPAPLFQPYVYQIRQALPPEAEMRLPEEVLLTAGPGLDPEELIVKLLPSENPGRLTIGLFTCQRSPFPCLVGGFSVEASSSTSAQDELHRHQAQGNPITLARGVRGYLREGTALKPSSEFSSLMWEQAGMIYTVSFLAAERENILTMGRSMANALPLSSVQPAASRQVGNNSQ
ncbi:MAG: hypothetical protein ACKO7W_03390 [Elainella sp.]